MKKFFKIRRIVWLAILAYLLFVFGYLFTGISVFAWIAISIVLFLAITLVVSSYVPDPVHAKALRELEELKRRERVKTALVPGMPIKQTTYYDDEAKKAITIPRNEPIDFEELRHELDMEMDKL